MEFYCKKCNHKLTQNPLKLAREEELSSEVGENLLKSGMYIPNKKNTDESNIFDNETPFIMNYLVAIDSIHLNDHEDRLRFIGCCGPSNYSVHNKVCPKCNAEIGTIIADCLTTHYIGIDATKITTKPNW